GYILEAATLGLTDGVAKHAAIGFGGWLGLIMAFNVWFIIWPAQQKVLGLVEVDAAAKASAARMAALTSRANTMLSIPMLYAMVSAQNLY
ncbi:MAG: urate hydroxylase PuuD, partial [Rhodospirillales bacterium]|nr:urate hydroxylase PuuD [Rhodospirillales bacterium]